VLAALAKLDEGSELLSLSVQRREYDARPGRFSRQRFGDYWLEDPRRADLINRYRACLRALGSLDDV